MTRLRLLFVSLALIFSFIAVRFVWTATHSEDDGSGARLASQAARVAAQTALHGTGDRVPAVAPAPAAPVAPAPAPAVEVLSGVDRRFADAGLSRGEAAAMKQAFPDWETRFATASDDMLAAHAARVKDFVPVTIPNEISHTAAVDLDAVIARSRAGGAGGVGVIDDVARGGGMIADDLARGGASMFDDVLRLLGLGGAAAGGAAAMAGRKKK